MVPRNHILIGIVVSFLLVFFLNFSLVSGLVIFLSSFLIDVDHYFLYVYRKKDLNPLAARKYFFNFVDKWNKIPKNERPKYQHGLIIFHGIEFWILLGLLSFLNPLFLWILMGVMIHMSADWFHIIEHKESLLYKISQVYVYTSNKNKIPFE